MMEPGPKIDEDPGSWGEKSKRVDVRPPAYSVDQVQVVLKLTPKIQC